MRCVAVVVLLSTLLLSGCAGVQSVKLGAGYGPFHAEIEIMLRQAEELRRVNGPDCPAAKAIEDAARARGAIEVEK